MLNITSDKRVEYNNTTILNASSRAACEYAVKCLSGTTLGDLDHYHTKQAEYYNGELILVIIHDTGTATVFLGCHQEDLISKDACIKYLAGMCNA